MSTIGLVVAIVGFDIAIAVALWDFALDLFNYGRSE
jgi:hypothetical protein